MIPPLPLTNFETQKYYQNEPRFNRDYSRENLPNKINDGAYVINPDEHYDIGTHWVALYVTAESITYFDSFGVKQIPKEIKRCIKRPIKGTIKRFTIITNIFRIQAYDSVMCGYFCIGFNPFMLKEKSFY